MHRYMNQGHMQFDLYIAGSAQQIIGKMIHSDEQGFVILKESDGIEHGYAWHVLSHVTEAP